MATDSFEIPKGTCQKLKQRPNNCKVRKLLDRLQPASRRELELMLSADHKEITARQIVDTLHDLGCPADLMPSADHVKAHRRRVETCRCPKDSPNG